MKIKINSDDDLVLEKVLTMQNVATLIKFVFDEDYNHYYSETLLEKCLHK